MIGFVSLREPLEIPFLDPGSSILPSGSSEHMLRRCTHEVTAGADAGGTRGQASRRHAPLSDDDVPLSILRRNGTKYTLFFVGKYLKNEFLEVALKRAAKPFTT